MFSAGDDMNYQIAQLTEFVLDVWHKGLVAAKKPVDQGIVEIKQALDRGLVTGDEPTCYTLQWYRSLIEWQKRIDGLMLNGKLL